MCWVCRASISRQPGQDGGSSFAGVPRGSNFVVVHNPPLKCQCRRGFSPATIGRFRCESAELFRHCALGRVVTKIRLYIYCSVLELSSPYEPLAAHFDEGVIIVTHGAH
jgi:hypothetical protein